MPRTALTPIVAKGAYAGSGVALPWVDADVANGNSFPASGKDLVLVRNTSATTPANVTLTSIADPFNRTGDVVEAVAAGATKAFGPFGVTGWRQTDGAIYLAGASVDLEFVVVVLL